MSATVQQVEVTDARGLVRKLTGPVTQGGIRINRDEADLLLDLIKIGALAVETRRRRVARAADADPVEIALEALAPEEVPQT